MIEKLHIKATSKMPEILADAEKGEISISGSVRNQNSVKFFQPLNDWLTTYFESPKELTRFNFRMKYLSNSASLMILDIIQRINSDFSLKRRKIVIYWYCTINDEEMYEVGEDYQDTSEVPFHIVMED